MSGFTPICVTFPCPDTAIIWCSTGLSRTDRSLPGLAWPRDIQGILAAEFDIGAEDDDAAN